MSSLRAAASLARFALRAPNGSGGDVEHYANRMVMALKPDDLEAVQPGTIGTAVGLGDGSPEAMTALHHEAWLAARRGTWVTTPDAKGVVLMDNRGLPVRRNDGTPFGFTFLQARGASQIPQDSGGLGGEPSPWGGF